MANHNLLSRLWQQAGQSKSRRKSQRSRPLSAETLEDRLLLTASHLSDDLPDDQALVEQALPGGMEQPAGSAMLQQTTTVDHDGVPGLCWEMQLRIDGTGIQFDVNTGLPNHIDGDVYYVGGMMDGQYAGTYQEDFSAILHPDYGFVGAIGVGVYSFATSTGVSTLGQLTVQYQAMIVGMNASGALLVNSAGSVVSGTAFLQGLEGSFTTNSAVSLWPTFGMEVNVTMQLWRSMPSALDVAAHEWAPRGPHHDHALVSLTSQGSNGWQADDSDRWDSLDPPAAEHHDDSASAARPSSVALQRKAGRFADDVDLLLGGSHGGWLRDELLHLSV